MDVVDLFRSAGAFGYLLLAGGMVVTPASVIGVVSGWVFGRKVAIGAAAASGAAGAALVLLGVLGWQYGVQQVAAAIAVASPEMHEALDHAGRSEALVPLMFALVVAAPALGSAAACAARVVRPPSAQAVVGGLALAAAAVVVCATGALWLEAERSGLRAVAFAEPAQRGALIAASHDAAALRLLVGGAASLALSLGGAGLLAVAPASHLKSAGSASAADSGGSR